VVKILGHSQLPVQTGIEHYNSCSELPPFGEILSMAKKVEMSAISFTIDTAAIFSFLIMNPNSHYIETYSKSLYSAADIDCHDRITIKMYNSFKSCSITYKQRYL
jgi:hypothetical protein